MMFRFVDRTEKLTLKKAIFLSLGTFSLFLGIVGLFIPVLPTTPFLLLSCYLYGKSSKRMYFWILNNRYFGKYISRYRDGKGIPLMTKIIAITAIWISITSSNIFFIPYLWLQILLYCVAAGVTYHLLSRPTYKEE